MRINLGRAALGHGYNYKMLILVISGDCLLKTRDVTLRGTYETTHRGPSEMTLMILSD